MCFFIFIRSLKLTDHSSYGFLAFRFCFLTGLVFVIVAPVLVTGTETLGPDDAEGVLLDPDFVPFLVPLALGFFTVVVVMLVGAAPELMFAPSIADGTRLPEPPVVLFDDDAPLVIAHSAPNP